MPALVACGRNYIAMAYIVTTVVWHRVKIPTCAACVGMPAYTSMHMADTHALEFFVVHAYCRRGRFGENVGDKVAPTFEGLGEVGAAVGSTEGDRVGDSVGGVQILKRKSGVYPETLDRIRSYIRSNVQGAGLGRGVG